jgi:hypothetical protein
VNPRVFLIAVVMAAVVLGGGWLFISRSTQPVPAEAPVADTAARETAPTPATSTRREPAGTPAPREGTAASASASATRGPATAAPAVKSSPTKGMLHVTSDVPEALVFLDRTFAGKAPVTIPNILLGPHKVNVSAEGFEGASQDVEIVAGAQNVEVRLREVRLKATIAVVHTHRIGSCSGTLIATPQGIRYDTPNAEDAFSVALADMDQFDVDYLMKNLRVKLRTGKTYNFTDPDGNADRLFVFQRDVEKARARLAKGDPPAG